MTGHTENIGTLAAQLTAEQLHEAAVIDACRCVSAYLRDKRIVASTGDPKALARIMFVLASMVAAGLLREGLEAGRTSDEALADGDAWLERHADTATNSLLESGVTYNVWASPVSAVEPEDAQ
jgi:hypothetical protein